MQKFISVPEARQLIHKEIRLRPRVMKNLLESLGHYLAEDILAPMDVPSFDNSAMDGYGFRFQPQQSSYKLEISGEIQAGALRLSSPKLNEAVAIYTGAPVPDGVDTVIMQEKVELKEGIVFFSNDQVKQGGNIRKRGSQTKKGEIIIPQGTFITPEVIGYLAGFGIPEVQVFNRDLKIALVTTGDELVPLGAPLKDYQIYNSNEILLQAQMKSLALNFIEIAHAKDSATSTKEKLKDLLEKSDVLLITGGISVGKFDFVQNALVSLGVEPIFYKLKQKPGKPLFFGKKGAKRVFALPGNPASVNACFHQYVKPYLLGCLGKISPFEDFEEAILSDAYDKKNDLTLFLKGRKHNGKVRVLSNQESYKMNSMAQANCFIEISGAKRKVSTEEKVKVWSL